MNAHKTLEQRLASANQMNAIGLEMLVRIYYDARPFTSDDLTSMSKRGAMNVMMRNGLVSAKPSPDDDVGYIYHLEDPGREYVEACLRLPLKNPHKAVKPAPEGPPPVFVNAYWLDVPGMVPLSAESAYKKVLEDVPAPVAHALNALFLAAPMTQQEQTLRAHGWRPYVKEGDPSWINRGGQP